MWGKVESGKCSGTNIGSGSGRGGEPLRDSFIHCMVIMTVCTPFFISTTAPWSYLFVFMHLRLTLDWLTQSLYSTHTSPTYLQPVAGPAVSYQLKPRMIFQQQRHRWHWYVFGTKNFSVTNYDVTCKCSLVVDPTSMSILGDNVRKGTFLCTATLEGLRMIGSNGLKHNFKEGND